MTTWIFIHTHTPLIIPIFLATPPHNPVLVHALTKKNKYLFQLALPLMVARRRHSIVLSSKYRLHKLIVSILRMETIHNHVMISIVDGSISLVFMNQPFLQLLLKLRFSSTYQKVLEETEC